MFPVTEASSAADWTAMAKLGSREEGKYWPTIWAAAEEKAGPEVMVEPLKDSDACWRGRSWGGVANATGKVKRRSRRIFSGCGRGWMQWIWGPDNEKISAKRADILNTCNR